MQKGIRLLATAAVFAFCLQVFSNNKADVDLWGNTGFVKALPWAPEFHYTNTFSFTEPDHPWINHEWLAEHIFWRTYTSLGSAGLLAIKVVAGLCVVLLINRSMKRDCRSGGVRFLYLMLIVSTMGYGFSTRPHHFTYLMMAVLLSFLRHQQRNRLVPLFMVAVMGVLWANLHGAFFIGPLLLTVFALLRAVGPGQVPEKDACRGTSRVLLAGALALVAASLVNPYGWRLWTFISQSAVRPRPYLSEWAMFHPLRDLHDHIDFVVLALLTLFAFCFSRARKDPAWTGLLVLSFLGSILMRRNIPLFAITAGFAAPPHLEKAAGNTVSRLFGKLPTAIIAVVLVFFVLVSGYYTARFDKTSALKIEIPAGKFPVSAVRFMQTNNISGNALVFFDWAEYCIWHLYPSCRVFLDGRFRSAYSAQTIDDYFNFLYAREGWQNALSEYDTDMVLIHRENPAHSRMLELGGWRLVFEDELCSLFLRSDRHRAFFDSKKAFAKTRGLEQQGPLYFP